MVHRPVSTLEVTTVVSAPIRQGFTIRDLAEMPDDGALRELVDGQIVEWGVPTLLHGVLLGRLAAELINFVVKSGLGFVAVADSMVKIQGSERHARGADIAFFARLQLPDDAGAPATDAVPDLVAEVLSPSDRADRVLGKVHDWLRAGVRLLWYVDPRTGVTTVYHGDRVSVVRSDETLDGKDVLPGFAVCVGDFLREFQPP